MYEPILDALRRGAHADALSAARDAVATAPQDAAARRLLALSLRQSGDADGALQAIDAAIAIAPEDAGLHLDRAGLLLDARQLDQAQSALARSLGLDPNQFPAYVMQAHLALGRGDLVEAERLAKTAARIAPGHPHIAAVEGMVALRRGDADRALAVLSQAAGQAPEEGTLVNALGFAYMAKGLHAFAEQAFRKVLERAPDSVPVRALLADTVRQQGRPAEAADIAAPLLDRPDASAALQRLVGEVELEAGRPERALPALKAAFTAMPDDRRTLEALIAAWRRTNDAEDARRTLDAAIATRPELDDLWRARLAFEAFGGPESLATVERWLQARPDHIPALQARAALHDHAGEAEEADAIAYQIAALEPGHAAAELRVVGRLLERDPAAAVARVQSLLQNAGANASASLRHLLAQCQDRAGDTAAAASVWAALQSDVAAERSPLPRLAGHSGDLPPLAERAEGGPRVLLLWGAPGSMVERIATTLHAAGAPLRIDRIDGRAPADPLQSSDTAQALRDGRVSPGDVIAQWRAALPARGIRDGQIADWLPWWDNALLPALRAHLPEAVLMVALRDPRDMLLDWLAFGSPQQYALASPQAGADWLADALGQIADLHEQDLFPHRLVRLDDVVDDPAGLAQAVGQALGDALPPPPNLGPRRLPAGRWRAYAEPMAAEFARLTPVAVRLGYPEA